MQIELIKCCINNFLNRLKQMLNHLLKSTLIHLVGRKGGYDETRRYLGDYFSCIFSFMDHVFQLGRFWLNACCFKTAAAISCGGHSEFDFQELFRKLVSESNRSLPFPCFGSGIIKSIS